jgi:hypothetical protein
MRTLAPALATPLPRANVVLSSGAWSIRDVVDIFAVIVSEPLEKTHDAVAPAA